MRNKKTKTIIMILAVIVAVIIIILLLTQCGKQEPVVMPTEVTANSSAFTTEKSLVTDEADLANSTRYTESNETETLPAVTTEVDPAISSEDIEASAAETLPVNESAEVTGESTDGYSTVQPASTTHLETSDTQQAATVPTTSVATSQAPTTATPTVPPTAPTTKATTPAPTTPTPTIPAPTTQPPTAHSHSFGDWVVLRTPTCTTLGLRRKTCSCGAWNEESIPKSDNHDWVTEQVLVRPAWDEQVLVKEAWEEQVLVKEAWEEEVEVYNWVYHDVCKGCESKGVLFFLDYLSDDELDAHDTQHALNGEEFGSYGKAFYEYIRTDIITHPPVYETVYHPAEYTTVHHEAEYANVEKCKNCGKYK